MCLIFDFFASFGLREVSQWRDLEISLQMAFGRARGDISRPKTGTGTILLTQISDNLAYPEFYNLAYPGIYSLPDPGIYTRVGETIYTRVYIVSPTRVYIPGSGRLYIPG